MASAVSAGLPRLRRYARALTGSREAGDGQATATIEALIADPDGLGADLRRAATPGDAKVALFGALHRVWAAAGAPLGAPDTPSSARAQDRLAGLAPRAREALLLHAIEGFEPREIGAVLGVGADAASDLVDAAIRGIEERVAGRVMIVEDEVVVALDLAAIVREMGHRVTGIARTRAEAQRLLAAERPDLVLADLRLADGSSGLDAAGDARRAIPDLPVIFVTAHPGRLLAEGRPEPAFLIAKPYGEDEVRSAVSQAMFFAPAETLAA